MKILGDNKYEFPNPGDNFQKQSEPYGSIGKSFQFLSLTCYLSQVEHVLYGPFQEVVNATLHTIRPKLRISIYRKGK